MNTACQPQINNSESSSSEDWSLNDLRERRKLTSALAQLENVIGSAQTALEKAERSSIGIRSLTKRFLGRLFGKKNPENDEDSFSSPQALRDSLQQHKSVYANMQVRLAEIDKRLYGTPYIKPSIATQYAEQASRVVVRPEVNAWQRHLSAISNEQINSTSPSVREVLETARGRARRAIEDQRAKIGALRPMLKVVSTPGESSPVSPQVLARNCLSEISPEKLAILREKDPDAADAVLAGIKRARHELGFNTSLHSEFCDLKEQYENLKLEAELLKDQKLILERRIASRGSITKLWIRFSGDRAQEELNEITERLANNERSLLKNVDRRIQIKSHFDEIAA